MKRIADSMVKGGFKDAGYEYVIIDDCWSERKRDNVTNRLVADKKRFPNGMKAVGDYLHSKGLKLGMYGDIGMGTCQGFPGSQEYLELDAQTIAEW